MALAFLKIHTDSWLPNGLKLWMGISITGSPQVRINPRNHLTKYKLIDNMLLEFSKKNTCLESYV